MSGYKGNENLPIAGQSGGRINLWAAVKKIEGLGGCNAGFAVIGNKFHRLSHLHGPHNESFCYPDNRELSFIYSTSLLFHIGNNMLQSVDI